MSHGGGSCDVSLAPAERRALEIPRPSSFNHTFSTSPTISSTFSYEIPPLDHQSDIKSPCESFWRNACWSTSSGGATDGLQSRSFGLGMRRFDKNTSKWESGIDRKRSERMQQRGSKRAHVRQTMERLYEVVERALLAWARTQGIGKLWSGVEVARSLEAHDDEWMWFDSTAGFTRWWEENFYQYTMKIEGRLTMWYSSMPPYDSRSTYYDSRQRRSILSAELKRLWKSTTTLSEHRRSGIMPALHCCTILLAFVLSGIVDWWRSRHQRG